MSKEPDSPGDAVGSPSSARNVPKLSTAAAAGRLLRVAKQDIMRMQKDLSKHFDKEAMTANPEAVPLLKRLTTVPMTRALLASTRIGVTIAKLRKVKNNAEVTALAAKLVKGWKVIAKAAKSPMPSPKPLSAVQALKQHQQASSPLSGKVKKQRRPASSTPKRPTVVKKPIVAKKPVKTQKKSAGAASTLPRARAVIVKLLTNALTRFIATHDDISADSVDVPNLTASIEEALHAAKNSGATVSNAYRSFGMELKHALAKNEALTRDVLSGKATPAVLASSSLEDLCDPAVRAKRIAQQKRDNESRELDWEQRHQKEILEAAGLKKQKGTFQCHECGSWDTTYTQKQTRSADEPMTTFVLCLVCKARSRFC